MANNRGNNGPGLPGSRQWDDFFADFTRNMDNFAQEMQNFGNQLQVEVDETVQRDMERVQRVVEEAQREANRRENEAKETFQREMERVQRVVDQAQREADGLMRQSGAIIDNASSVLVRQMNTVGTDLEREIAELDDATKEAIRRALFDTEEVVVTSTGGGIGPRNVSTEQGAGDASTGVPNASATSGTGKRAATKIPESQMQRIEGPSKPVIPVLSRAIQSRSRMGCLWVGFLLLEIL